jgi:hypothetical protein
MHLKYDAGRRILKIKWTDRVKNNEIFQRAKKERSLLKI